MPVSVKRIGGKYRVVGPDGTPETNASGTPVDGGGHENRRDAEAQARAINASTGGKK